MTPDPNHATAPVTTVVTCGILAARLIGWAA